MNIFVLSTKPAACARYHCDRHVVKMPLETTQMLVSAFYFRHGLKTRSEIAAARPLVDEIFAGFPRIYEDGSPWPYGLVHENHPCTIWCRTAAKNWLWGLELGFELCREYTYRYGKRHAVEPILEWASAQEVPAPARERRTPFAQAMSDECKARNAVTAYRDFYHRYKFSFASWKDREPPPWWQPEVVSVG